MEHVIIESNEFESLKAKFTVENPDSIRERLADWAFDDAESIADAVRRLESIDCAGCHSPAPVYYEAMAGEIARHWPEIDDALDSYRDATGEGWTPRADQNFLTYLWFAYEWLAHDLAAEIRNDSESNLEE